ncbi:MAG: hypothetical protein GWP15_03520 [Nitrospirae bacterium]|nr:hypothetical protein [Nitrospirota bacterium]
MPLPPLDKIKLQKLQIDVRKYRNRRVGEFLKELHLTEGRSTGIPTILREMEKNHSPAPVFDTDDERSYFKTTFVIHSEFLKPDSQGPAPDSVGTKLAPSWQVAKLKLNLNPDEFQALFRDYLKLDLGQFEEIVRSVSQVCPKSVPAFEAALILLIARDPIDLKSLMGILKRTNRTRFKNKFIDPLIDANFIEYLIPDKPKSQFQKYLTTDKGKKLLELIMDH